MKRDLDLIRKILFNVEDVPAGKTINCIDFGDAYDKATIFEHVKLLINAKYVDGKYVLHSSGGSFCINGLTWSGHDFVQASRNDTIWDAAKNKVKSIGESVAFDVFTELLKSITKNQLNL